MKSHFFGYIFAVLTIVFALPAQSVFYGVCCPVCDEPQQIKIKKDDCDCVCPNDSKEAIGSDGNIICCDGATNISTNQIDQSCCEREAIGGVYVTKGAQGIEGVCCKKDSSKTIEGTFETMCCIEAGGAEVSKGKCCRQAPQGS